MQIMNLSFPFGSGIFPWHRLFRTSDAFSDCSKESSLLLHVTGAASSCVILLSKLWRADSDPRVQLFRKFQELSRGILHVISGTEGLLNDFRMRFSLGDIFFPAFFFAVILSPQKAASLKSISPRYLAF